MNYTICAAFANIMYANGKKVRYIKSIDAENENDGESSLVVFAKGVKDICIGMKGKKVVRFAMAH